ncbi:MAG: acylneuraminate cytidylyltransferase family protein, partial [Anaerolineales bacterium]
GGSKSVPRKNLADLLGKPLIAYTIEAAKHSRRLSHYVVSSEDAEILAVAKELGAPAPFVRPQELASDQAPSLPVVQHAIREMERMQGLTFDYVVLLQPTTPMRRAEDIDAALDKLIATGADSVISVCDVGAYHPARMRRIVDDRLVELPVKEPREMARRQDLPPVYIRNGAIYAARRDLVMIENSMVGDDCRAFVMPEERSVNIDGRLDLLMAEILMREQQAGEA